MRRRSRNNPLVLTAYAGILILCVGGLGYAAMQSYGKQVADEYGCFADAQQPQSFVMFDASEPRFNDEQARSLRTYFDRLYENLSFNERLSFITSEADQVASVSAPRFYVCGQAKSPKQLEEIGAASSQAGYLKKQKQRLYDHVVAPEYDALLSENPDDERRQYYQSPIMEMIADISRLRELERGSRLIIVSDLIQNSDSVRFCRVRGDMPEFKTFKKRPAYSLLKPKSLENIEVEILLVQRMGYGQEGYDYCSGEKELMAFWGDFFTDNGASVHFIRIRHGNIEG